MENLKQKEIRVIVVKNNKPKEIFPSLNIMEKLSEAFEMSKLSKQPN
jgi:hypothetical protein